MGSVLVKIPLVTWRDGRPRFFAGPLHRRLGFRGEDLRHNSGTWFSFEEAVAWSQARVAEVGARKAALAAGRRTPPRLAVRGALTVAGLLAAWFDTPRMKGRHVVEGKKKRKPLKPLSVANYRDGARLVERFDGGRLWSTPAAAISGRAWAAILDKIEIARGLNQARKVRSTVSAAYSFGVAAGKVPANPFAGLKLGLPTPDERIRYGSIEEMHHLVKAADLTLRRGGKAGATITCADVGDCIVLGLWTGQRQNDRLALEDGRDTPDGIVFRQSKKGGQPLLIPKAPDLAVRLAAARQRRAGWRVNYPNVILDEGGRCPFLRRWYGELFALVRRTAVHGMLWDGTVPADPLTPPQRRALEREHGRDGAWRLPPLPSLADFHDQDLRDTAVTWLALAGATKWEIMSITGHALKSIDTILGHYLGMHPELARSAIAKLVAWHEKGEG